MTELFIQEPPVTPTKLPALIVVAPLYVFLPASVSVPDPVFVKATTRLAPLLITPE
jgi:hypothetical protein